MTSEKFPKSVFPRLVTIFSTYLGSFKEIVAIKVKHLSEVTAMV